MTSAYFPIYRPPACIYVTWGVLYIKFIILQYRMKGREPPTVTGQFKFNWKPSLDQLTSNLPRQHIFLHNTL
jgi:hypothetical protein